MSDIKSNTENSSANYLDKIDWKLLEILQEDSKLTTKEIAQRVNLTSTPVYERIKRLEREGYIQKYIAVVNAEKIGKSLTVFCYIKLKQHSKKIGHQFVNDVILLEEVTECYNISGDYDFLLKILIPDMKHYQSFVLDKLGMIQNISSTHSTFVMGVIKHSYSVPL